MLMLLTWAAPAAAADVPRPADAFGVNGGILWADGLRSPQTAPHAQGMRLAGLGTVRVGAYWNHVEPAPPYSDGTHRFRWDSTDAIASDLAGNGLRWNPLLAYATGWGGTIPGVVTSPPKPAPFVAYATAVARRYGRNGSFWHENPSIPYVPVTTYEVWNEPNLFAFWPPQAQPDRYADLYLAVRSAIRAVDPFARVTVGGLAHSIADDPNNASGFLERMLAHRPGLRGNVDGVGLNIYTSSPERVLALVADARSTLDALGLRDVPLSINETGWTTSGFVPLTEIAPVTDSVRGERLRRLVELIAGSDCGVTSLSVFAWATAEDNRLDASAWYGLADRRTGRPKPSGVAFAAPPRPHGWPRSVPRSQVACHRPDLPGLVAAPHPKRVPLRLRVTRRCRSRWLVLRVTLGAEAEPYRRFDIALPDGQRRTLLDPDGAGPRNTKTITRMRVPRVAATVVVQAFDELGRLRAMTSQARAADAAERPGGRRARCG